MIDKDLARSFMFMMVNVSGYTVYKISFDSPLRVD